MPGRPTQRPEISVHLEFSVADAATHPVLDEIRDDGRGLSVDPDRQRQTTQNVGAEIRDGDGDLVGRELDPDDARGVRVELQHHAGPAAAGVAQGAD